MFKSLIFIFLVFTLSSHSQAGFKGSISFTQAEKDRHQQGLADLLATAGDCLKADLQYHQQFYAANGFSPFYGDQSSFAKKSKAEKKAELAKYGKADFVDSMQPTSCIGLTLKCLEAGFAKAGQADLWKPLYNFTMANDVDGTALQHGLRALGWYILYWNPNTARSAVWDIEEQAANPGNPLKIWGFHEQHWINVSKGGKYLYNTVDNYTFLTDFMRTPPPEFTRAPFFVGTAHGGYHVFPGFYGHVIEGHSKRSIDDSQTIEDSPFNPLLKGGGPRGNYFSGLMAIPPSFEKSLLIN